MKTKTEHERFEDLLRGILRVPHSEIKAKLDAQKKVKKVKRGQHDHKNHNND